MRNPPVLSWERGFVILEQIQDCFLRRVSDIIFLSLRHSRRRSAESERSEFIPHVLDVVFHLTEPVLAIVHLRSFERGLSLIELAVNAEQ